jgi:flagellar assembly factor FliW
MKVSSTRFEDLESLEIADDAIVVFPEGIPGFEQHSLFGLIEDQRFPGLSWLQSVHDPEIVFLLVDPAGIARDYAPPLDDQDLECLNLTPSDPVVDLRCIAIVWRDEHRITANLRAPVVLNRKERLGKQVILTDDQYDLRHPFYPLAARPVA